MKKAIFPLIVFTVATMILAVTTTAQTLRFHDVPGRSGVETAYDRFHDRTILSTKRELVTAQFSTKTDGDGRRPVEISAGIVHAGQKLDKVPATVYLVVNPNLTTGRGRFVEEMQQQADREPLYFAPEAPLVAILDGERLPLGQAEKSGAPTMLGRYDGAAYLEIPLASFRRLAAAREVEIALGSAELMIPAKVRRQWAALVAEIDSRAGQ